MADTIRIISSMATRQLLADLGAEYTRHSGQTVETESVGGVDAAKRVQANEPFDVVVLAANAIDSLIAAGKVVEGSRVDLVTSSVAIAVRAGTKHPEIDTEHAVKDAVLAAKSISYSTGPSGVQLARLFERWGIADVIAPRLVQAPPGVAVGSLVASGQVELGFQQLSEMLDLPGIDVIGGLPPAIEIITTFSGGIATTCKNADAARDMLAWMASPAATAAKEKQGMDAA